MEETEGFKVAYLGSDETGTGDLLTPIVSACVFVPEENRDLLTKQRITDSKKLSDSYIINFFKTNKHLFLYSWNTISQARYNKLTASFNANQIKLFLHYANIKNFLEKNPNLVEVVIIDRFSTEGSIRGYEQILFRSLPEFDLNRFNVKVRWEIKAEQAYLEVALASMVARYFLLDLLKKQQERWDFSFPLGASAEVDLAAKRFIEIHGKEKLAEVAKLNFKNTARILGGD